MVEWSFSLSSTSSEARRVWLAMLSSCQLLPQALVGTLASEQLCNEFSV